MYYVVTELPVVMATTASNIPSVGVTAIDVRIVPSVASTAGATAIDVPSVAATASDIPNVAATAIDANNVQVLVTSITVIAFFFYGTIKVTGFKPDVTLHSYQGCGLDHPSTADRTLGSGGRSGGVRPSLGRAIPAARSRSPGLSPRSVSHSLLI